MPRNFCSPKTLVASAARITTTSFTVTIPVADAYTFYLNSAAGTGTSPTLDVSFLVTPDDGTTWLPAPMRFTQVTTAALSPSITIPQNRAMAVSTAASTAATGGLLGTAVVLSTKLKITATIGGTNPSFTFAVYCFPLIAAN